MRLRVHRDTEDNRDGVTVCSGSERDSALILAGGVRGNHAGIAGCYRVIDNRSASNGALADRERNGADWNHSTTSAGWDNGAGKADDNRRVGRIGRERNCDLVLRQRVIENVRRVDDNGSIRRDVGRGRGVVDRDGVGIGRFGNLNVSECHVLV